MAQHKENINKKYMNHLDLFSGIGGFALAASWVWGKEHNIVSFVEIDKFCQKVLKKHWPDVPIIPDIRDCTIPYLQTLDFIYDFKAMADAEPKRYKERVQSEEVSDRGRQKEPSWNLRIDLLTGGFPCQPFSVAGKQQGAGDNRYLWPQMLRVIQGLRPTWIIGENVAGIINMALDQVLSELESASYEVQSFVIPACAVDAPHRRDRVWIVANTLNGRPQIRRPETDGEMGKGTEEWKASMHISAEIEESSTLSKISQDVADTGNKGLQGAKFSRNNDQKTKKRDESATRPTTKCRSNAGSNWLPEPNVGRVAHGVPQRVDRLKSLGNAIVPQCVVPIMQAIKGIDAIWKNQIQ